MEMRFLNKDRLDIYNDWVNNKLSKEEVKELNLLTESDKYDAFYKDLEFGTGGIRAIIGPGTNRLNKITVSKFANSFLKYLKSHYKNENIKVVIGYDTRLYSPLFAEIIAGILINGDVQVMMFKSFVPTPVLSFAVKELGCNAGLNITASHNPFYYNGIKVYNSSGGQILNDEANEIALLMKENDYVDNQLANKKAEIIDEQIFDNYLYNLKKLDKSYTFMDKVNVIYSPLNGGCIDYCNKVLDSLNVNYTIVSSHNKPDSYFKSVKVPNPENIEVFTEGMRYLNEWNADCIAVSDPDGDRLGVVLIDNEKLYHLNGNELGALIIKYLCEINNYHNGYVVSSIVSNNLGKNIALKHNLKYYQTLTGFKYIYNKIIELKNDTLVLGYEESCGYLLNYFTGDKDSFQALTVLLNMIAYYKNKGKNLIEVLENIYNEYGYYSDKQIVIEENIDLDGLKKKLENSRVYNVSGLYDFNNLYYFDYKLNNKKIILDFHKANVLKYIIDDNSFIAIRPSGTENKIKIYISICCKTKKESLNKLNLIVKEIKDKVEEVVK